MTRRILLALVSAMALSQAACGGDNTRQSTETI